VPGRDQQPKRFRPKQLTAFRTCRRRENGRATQEGVVNHRPSAIGHSYHECGLMTTFIYGFRYVNGKYERDKAVTKEVSDTE
jgi:hypothetical protein